MRAAASRAVHAAAVRRGTPGRARGSRCGGFPGGGMIPARISGVRCGRRRPCGRAGASSPGTDGAESPRAGAPPPILAVSDGSVFICRAPPSFRRRPPAPAPRRARSPSAPFMIRNLGGHGIDCRFLCIAFAPGGPLRVAHSESSKRPRFVDEEGRAARERAPVAPTGESAGGPQGCPRGQAGRSRRSRLTASLTLIRVNDAVMTLIRVNPSIRVNPNQGQRVPSGSIA